MSLRFCFLDSFWTKSKRLPKSKIEFVGSFHFLAKHLTCRLSLYIYLWEERSPKDSWIIFPARFILDPRNFGRVVLSGLHLLQYDRILANASLPRLTNCLLLPRHCLELDLLCSYAATGEQSIGHMIVTQFSLYFSQASFTFPNTLTKYQFILCSKICVLPFFLQICAHPFSRPQPERAITVVLDHT